MGNEYEIEITLDKVRHLRLDLNAMVDFEKATSKSVWTLSGDMTATDMRALIWACLRHEEPTLLPGDVGGMIHVGNLTDLAKAIAELFKGAMPEEEKTPASPLARGHRPTG